MTYRPAGVVDSQSRRFVITDGNENIYLVAAAQHPQPHLEAVAEAKVGPYPITSPVVVAGDMAIAIGGDNRPRAQEPAGMAPRTASYSIDATLDPSARTITFTTLGATRLTTGASDMPLPSRRGSGVASTLTVTLAFSRSGFASAKAR